MPSMLLPRLHHLYCSGWRGYPSHIMPRMQLWETHNHFCSFLRPQIQGLPTMVFVGTDTTKPALRTEGLLPAETIKQIVADEIGS